MLWLVPLREEPDGHIPTRIRGGGNGDSPVAPADPESFVPPSDPVIRSVEVLDNSRVVLRRITSPEPIAGSSMARDPEGMEQDEASVDPGSSEDELSRRPPATREEDIVSSQAPTQWGLLILKRKRIKGRPRLDRSGPF